MKLLSAFSSHILTGPPHLWFFINAIFHYLGPSFAVLLFERIDVVGAAWFRIAGAAVVFAFWTKPWQTFRAANQGAVMLILLPGVRLAFMNILSYLAIEWLSLNHQRGLQISN